MAILNATDVTLSITPTGGSLTAVAHSTSASISMNMDLRDSTTKSSYSCCSVETAWLKKTFVGISLYPIMSIGNMS